MRKISRIEGGKEKKKEGSFNEKGKKYKNNMRTGEERNGKKYGEKERHWGIWAVKKLSTAYWRVVFS